MTNAQDSRKKVEIDSIIIVPTLNEVRQIEAVIASLRESHNATARSELWVVDGGSDDGTQQIVEKIADADRDVRLIHNPQRVQASAMNRAARLAAARGGITYLIRADAHAKYPPGWVVKLIDTAVAQDADSVVVPMQTCGGGVFRDASADLFNSWLGNGGSAHRAGGEGGLVEHGHHALFRLDVFLAVGGYDVRFLANEDAEFDMRMIKAGKRIFLEPEAAIRYYPRERLRDVYRQFFRNGRYRVCTSLKHNTNLGPRQLAPIALTLGLVASYMGGVLLSPYLAAPMLAYGVSVLAASTCVASVKSVSRIGCIFATATTAHIAFGLGGLYSLVSFVTRSALPVERASPPAAA